MKISFEDVLLLMFIYLKLTDVIDWSWWWVMSPLILVILTTPLRER